LRWRHRLSSKPTKELLLVAHFFAGSRSDNLQKMSLKQIQSPSRNELVGPTTPQNLLTGRSLHALICWQNPAGMQLADDPLANPFSGPMPR
jgi:hypothetical protein